MALLILTMNTVPFPSPPTTIRSTSLGTNPVAFFILSSTSPRFMAARLSRIKALSKNSAGLNEATAIQLSGRNFRSSPLRPPLRKMKYSARLMPVSRTTPPIDKPKISGSLDFFFLKRRRGSSSL